MNASPQIASRHIEQSDRPTERRGSPDGALKILAVSSGGGHWVELMRLMEAFASHRIHYATVRSDYRCDVGRAPFHLVRDATRWNGLGLAYLALQILVLVLRVRPDVVLSTGAAPGFFAVWFGHIIGAQTIWIDSLANVDELSRAGRMAGRYADLWLTQWPELASPDGPEYAGSVL
jgi:UDP-N-acetylglucosamine:LPS N-acetylglucosamine transferase